VRTLVLSILCALPVVAALGAEPGDEPPYPHGDYREDCSMCHAAEGWIPAHVGPGFEHGARSGFRLQGAHARVACRTCHLSLEFLRQNAECASCHDDPHDGEFGGDCAACHSTRSFIDRADEVRSHRLTRFPLSGTHATLDCEDCHPLRGRGGLRFVGTPTDCFACHRALWAATTNPDHTATGFDTDCERCHTTVSWMDARFDHGQAGFPLTGAHRRIDCEACHAGGVWSGVPSDCVACHLDAYQATTEPDHAAVGFPTDCAACHDTTAWEPARFDHAFPLRAPHDEPCSACHLGSNLATFSCDGTCHQHTESGMASRHGEVSGYAWDFNLCVQCHPDGRRE